MSYYDYKKSEEIFRESPPFYALIMAAMLKADSINLMLLKAAFPETYRELDRRYNAPGGLIDDERINT